MAEGDTQTFVDAAERSRHATYNYVLGELSAERTGWGRRIRVSVKVRAFFEQQAMGVERTCPSTYSTGGTMLVGYARDIGASHSLELQLRALSDAGCAKIFAQQKSWTQGGTRDALQCALDFVSDGDTLVVTWVDRLAPSPTDIQDIIARLAGSGVGLHCLQQSRMIPDRREEASIANLGAVAA